ncbi:MAG TPA: hypothetical protein VF530_21065 [Planctomycetota bacterium]
MKPEPTHDDALAPERLARLAERAEHDPSASAELDFLADLAAGLELTRARQAAPARPPAPRFLVRPWLPAAAASLLFLLALGAWLLRDDRHTDQRFAAREAPPYLASELRGAEAPSGFAAAMEPYTRGDWPAARTGLEACLAERPEHGPTRFYLAVVCDQLGDLARAEELYRGATASPDTLLAGHARLRLAQLLVERGDLGGARAELERLVESVGELAPSARALLETLGER